MMKGGAQRRGRDQQYFRCRINRRYTAFALCDQAGKSEGRDSDFLRASIEARFEVVRTEHNDHQIEWEMTGQNRREELGAIEDSASEVRRWEIDFKIIQVRCPCA